MHRLFVISVLAFLFFSPQVFAIDLGEVVRFNIDSGYDISAREETTGVLVANKNNLRFYFDRNWWDSQTVNRQQEILGVLEQLSGEFDRRIYPNLTSIFGSERKPGIDGDARITIFFHPMKEEAGGYFRPSDEYLKVQSPSSNEREMLYLNTSHIDSSQLKAMIAHEFVHLITFNQKDFLRTVSEEVWLNELRAEYAITALGYNDLYQGSNLQNRIKAFLQEPFDSLAEWGSERADYGIINAFGHYFVDHYGIDILSSSLKSSLVGIPSVNEFLSRNGFREDFKEIFSNWAIAVLINDCSLGNKYCYLNVNLKNIKVNPSLNFLPLGGTSSLSVTNTTKNWAGNWQRIIGGKGNLKLQFSALKGLDFRVPYILYDVFGKYTLGSVKVNSESKGDILITEFGESSAALVIIPILQTKLIGFNDIEPAYSFTFSVSVEGDNQEQETELIARLLVQIEDLKKQIAETRAKIDALLGRNTGSLTCTTINVTLTLGARGEGVKCLQQFLVFQGVDIYPEGIVSGYFGQLTRQAVIKFQEKYHNEILNPIGLTQGTGIVGLLTRGKINQLLSP